MKIDPRTLLATASLVCTSCVSVDQPYPERRYFVLDVTRPDLAPTAIEASTPPTVVLQRLRVSPAFESRGLVYANADGSFESDYYNEFFLSPGAMLTVELGEWLDASGLFAHVVDAASQIDGRLVLEGTVTKLYGDFTGDDVEAVLGLQVFLVDRDEPDTVQFHAEYEERRPARDGAPDELVAGWNEALSAVLTRLEADLSDR